MELTSEVPVLKKKRLEGLRTSQHPYRHRIIDSEHWGKFLTRTKPKVVDGMTLDSKEKIREAQKTALHQSVDGAGLKTAGNAPASNAWVDEGTCLMTGSRYVEAIKIRGNLIATAHRTSRGASRRNHNRLCDAGCQKPETLAHISQTCPRTWAPRIARHDAITNYVGGRLRELGWNVKKEEPIPTRAGVRKPDIVATKGARAVVTDITIVADHINPDEALKRKVLHYDTMDIREHIRGPGTTNPAPNIKFSAVVMTWRGTWSKKSAEETKDLGLTNQDLKMMAVRSLERTAKIVSYHRKSTERWGEARGRHQDGRPP